MLNETTALTTSLSPPLQSPADDTLEGTAAIAHHIGKSVRRTQYLLETKTLPAFKIGGRWNLRKSTYLKFLERLEAGA